MVEQNFTFFLPVMSLVVLELSRITRDIDLCRAVSRKRRSLFLSEPAEILASTVLLFILSIVYIIEKGLEKLPKLKKSYESYKMSILSYIVLILSDPDEPMEELDEQLTWILILLALSDIGIELNDYTIGQRHRQLFKNTRHQIINKSEEYVTKIWPPIGRFAIIHSANSVILGYLYVLSIEQPSGSITKIASVIVIALWSLIPFLEIEEIDLMLENQIKIRSIYVHIISVWLFYPIYSRLHPFGPEHPFRVSISEPFLVFFIRDYVIITGLGVISVWIFIQLLYKEIQKLPNNRPRRSYYN